MLDFSWLFVYKVRILDSLTLNSHQFQSFEDLPSPTETLSICNIEKISFSPSDILTLNLFLTISWPAFSFFGAQHLSIIRYSCKYKRVQNTDTKSAWTYLDRVLNIVHLGHTFLLSLRRNLRGKMSIKIFRSSSHCLSY